MVILLKIWHLTLHSRTTCLNGNTVRKGRQNCLLFIFLTWVKGSSEWWMHKHMFSWMRELSAHISAWSLTKAAENFEENILCLTAVITREVNFRLSKQHAKQLYSCTFAETVEFHFLLPTCCTYRIVEIDSLPPTPQGHGWLGKSLNDTKVLVAFVENFWLVQGCAKMAMRELLLTRTDQLSFMLIRQMQINTKYLDFKNPLC